MTRQELYAVKYIEHILKLIIKIISNGDERIGRLVFVGKLV